MFRVNYIWILNKEDLLSHCICIRQYVHSVLSHIKPIFVYAQHIIYVCIITIRYKLLVYIVCIYEKNEVDNANANIIPLRMSVYSRKRYYYFFFFGIFFPQKLMGWQLVWYREEIGHKYSPQHQWPLITCAIMNMTIGKLLIYTLYYIYIYM